MFWYDAFGLSWSLPLHVTAPWNPTWKPGAGVYLLRALAQDGDPVPIARACHIDESGTLYIGSAGGSARGSLEKRVNVLRRSLLGGGNTGDHAAGLLWARLPIMSQTFSLDRLAAQWSECPDAPKVEENLITAYAERFGETPPLNRRRSRVVAPAVLPSTSS